MEHKGTTAIIPSVRGAANPALLAVLMSVVNQNRPPSRILVLDMGDESLLDNLAIRRFADHFHIEILRSPKATTAVALNHLVNEANTEWIWIIPDDLVPGFDCLEMLHIAAAEFNADLASGVKLEVVRRDPWGEDWNRMNHPFPGIIIMPWADTANLLVRRKVWLESDTTFDPGEGINGEDVVTTARMGERHTIVGCGKAVGFHIPSDEHRWATGEGDELCIGTLKGVLNDEHFEWFTRFIKRS